MSVYANNYEETVNGCMTGCISETQEEIENFFGEPKNFQLTRASLPKSIDLSADPCFPPIGNQKRLGSCSSFATTYYQFTYETNKLNGVTNKNDAVIYSPKWTYNLSNHSSNSGTEITDNYKVLQDLGCLKNSDFPYTGDINDYTDIPRNMKDEKLEALSTRISKTNLYSIPNTSLINSPNSQFLNNIKTALSQGKILTSETECMFNSANVNGKCIVYRCSRKIQATHAVTIVGYDDNVSYDVNGNGTIEEYEKGALKVANSWGTTYNSYGISSDSSHESPGYFWVLYDALNLTSANTINNWETNFNTIRYPAFSVSNASNGYSNFFSIDVEHKNVNIVGMLDINTTDREGIKMQINCTNQSITSWIPTNAYTIANIDQNYLYDETMSYFTNQNIPYDGYILFDYGSFTEPISQHICGYNWHIRLDNIQSNSTVASLSLIDNMGNTISGYNHLTSGNIMTLFKNVSLQRGDVNYDGLVDSSDSMILLNYVSMITKFSNLQKVLGDYNNDGEVNITDVIAINNNLLSTANKYERMRINEINKRAHEFIALYGEKGNLNEIY